MRLCVPASLPSIVFIDAEASIRIDDAARLAIDDAERRIERGEQHEPEDEQDEQQRDEALELLPQRVGVLLLEDALPQLRRTAPRSGAAAS